MDANVTTLVLALLGGVIVGLLPAHPSARILRAAAAVGLGVLAFELARALAIGIPLRDLTHVLSLSTAPAFQRFIGGMALAYGALLAAYILALRLLLTTRNGSHDRSEGAES
jgi:hypothetical protein